MYPHLNNSTGGRRYATPENGYDNYVLRDPPKNNENNFIDQSPWYHKSYTKAHTVDPGDWNASGPVRQALHFRTLRYRRFQGDFHSDSTGMHSRLPKNAVLKSNRPQTMAGGHTNLLTVNQYRGQSYSDTTLVANEHASVTYPNISFPYPNVVGVWGGNPRG